MVGLRNDVEYVEEFSNLGAIVHFKLYREIELPYALERCAFKGDWEETGSLNRWRRRYSL